MSCLTDTCPETTGRKLFFSSHSTRRAVKCWYVEYVQMQGIVTMSESVSAQGMFRKSVAQGGLVPDAQPGLPSPQPDWMHTPSFLPC